MSSLIEQAAHRLQQLRQAGVDLPQAKTSPLRQPETPQRVTELPQGALSRRIDIDLDALAAAGIVSPNAPRSRIACARRR